MNWQEYLSEFIPSSASREPIFCKKGTRSGMDVTLFVLTIILLVFGLIMMFSASYAFAYYNNGADSFYYIRRQALFAILGVTAMIVISRVNYKILQKYSLLLLGGTLVLLLLVLTMRDANGFARWIRLGGLSFQPSEIAKFAIIVVFAHFAAQNASRMNTFMYGFVPFVAVLGAVCGLVVLERHLSGTILIGLLGVFMMFFGGTEYKWFAVLLVAGALGILIALFIPGFLEYARGRIEVWQNPSSSNLLDEAFQTNQSLIAIGSGGFWGKGLGNSLQKLLYIPEPQNDFVFAVVCEELGFIGASITIILFALLVWRGLTIAKNAKDRFGALLAAGCTIHVGLQAALNIAVVTNTIPNTGISLPFFSYGGTALMMLLGEMGVILSVSRNCTQGKG